MIIVGVSGGIDSMVLLDKLFQEGHRIVVAHVNYQKRAESYLDALVIKEYLQDKNIIFEELAVEKKDYNNDNFQKQAREIRYNFFKELTLKYQTNDVYIAHHKDDYLETYLFQKNRTGLYDCHGIKELSEINGMLIHRPLIGMYKKEIEDYAKLNGIKYEQDYSNYRLDYTRNKIRVMLNEYTHNQKEALYLESVSLNKQVDKENKIIEKYNKKIISVEEFAKLSKDAQRRLLFKKIKKTTITTRHLDEIISKLLSVNSFIESFLDTTIAKAYGNIYMLDFFEKDYKYLIENENEYTQVEHRFKDNYDYDLKKPDLEYPYIIRNYYNDDFIELDISYTNFRKKIKKNKIPFFLRDRLPIVTKDGRVRELL